MIEKCCQPDEIFVRKHGQEFCASLGESLEQPSNTPSHVAAVYTTLALYCVELGCKETMMDILRLLKNIQVTLNQYGNRLQPIRVNRM